jgi:hypothetical protein
LQHFFLDLAVRLRSSKFLQSSRHAEHQTGFSQQRKFPLPTLVALMLTGTRLSIKSELDIFFAFFCKTGFSCAHNAGTDVRARVL